MATTTDRNVSVTIKEKSIASRSPGREKAKAKLSQKASGESQRSKMRMSPGLLSGPEVTTPRRNTTGKKQPRRTERSNSVEDNQNQTWSRTNQQR